ncbi:MAG: hypothetical protein JWN27_2967 [Candidatus Eremiobacteraeota bacterium]|nr:hypothetical protein [Candidatus Eremiobacteraeota bacterium]
MNAEVEEVDLESAILYSTLLPDELSADRDPRVFKKVVGVTPGAWQRGHRK